MVPQHQHQLNALCLPSVLLVPVLVPVLGPVLRHVLVLVPLLYTNMVVLPTLPSLQMTGVLFMLPANATVSI